MMGLMSIALCRCKISQPNQIVRRMRVVFDLGGPTNHRLDRVFQEALFALRQFQVYAFSLASTSPAFLVTKRTDVIHNNWRLNHSSCRFSCPISPSDDCSWSVRSATAAFNRAFSC